MPTQVCPTLEEAILRLKMNRSMIEMLLDNTPPDAIAKLRREWVEPWEEIVRGMERDTLCEHPGDQDPQP
jgi:hypothetical protein